MTVAPVRLDLAAATLEPSHAPQTLASPATGTVRIAEPPRANLIQVAQRRAAAVEAPAAVAGQRFRQVLDNRPATAADWATGLRDQERITDARVLELMASDEGIEESELISLEIANALLQAGYQPQHQALIAERFGASADDVLDDASDWSKWVAGLAAPARERLRRNQMSVAEFVNLTNRDAEEDATEATFDPTFKPFRADPTRDAWSAAALEIRFTMADRWHDYDAARHMMDEEERKELDDSGVALEDFQKFLTAATQPLTRAILEQRFGYNINQAATPDEKRRLDAGKMTPAEFSFIGHREADEDPKPQFRSSSTMPN